MFHGACPELVEGFNMTMICIVFISSRDSALPRSNPTQPREQRFSLGLLAFHAQATKEVKGFTGVGLGRFRLALGRFEDGNPIGHFGDDIHTTTLLCNL